MMTPVMIAAAQEISTLTFPREARCGLELLEPNLQTTALMIKAITERINPLVIAAPTTVRNAAIPDSPE